ncbi:hypothetical protein FHX47_000695 [Garicola koreensis]|uniref:Uncharacterized protein n=1 Tax=Garicola koreensis TaxID=1262554 RepID=A0A7W5XNT4_9MICC|nr:hypothetical protein [Garicola koreensis]
MRRFWNSTGDARVGRFPSGLSKYSVAVVSQVGPVSREFPEP